MLMRLPCHRRLLPLLLRPAAAAGYTLNGNNIKKQHRALSKPKRYRVTWYALVAKTYRMFLNNRARDGRQVVATTAYAFATDGNKHVEFDETTLSTDETILYTYQLKTRARQSARRSRAIRLTSSRASIDGTNGCATNAAIPKEVVNFLQGAPIF